MLWNINRNDLQPKKRIQAQLLFLHNYDARASGFNCSEKLVDCHDDCDFLIYQQNCVSTKLWKKEEIKIESHLSKLLRESHNNLFKLN